jgi:polar amino acid transport system permease protein
MQPEAIPFLFAWTPYLLGGFFWNVLITVVAVTLGTSIGTGLAWMRVTKPNGLFWVAESITKVLCNVPTLAFTFYIAFVFPKEFAFPITDTVIAVPVWIKAALGMSASTAGFTAISLAISHKARARGDADSALLFIPTWGNSAMISFVASTTASLVGVNEIVSRCNYLIGATGTSVMIPLYMYCGSFFVVTCVFWMYLIRKAKQSRLLRSFAKRCGSPPPAVVST